MNQMLVPELIAVNDYTHAVPALGSAGRYARIVARAEACIAHIDQIIDQGFTCSSATSFGKDSTVVLVLMLEAIRRRVEAGLYVPAALSVMLRPL